MKKSDLKDGMRVLLRDGNWRKYNAESGYLVNFDGGSYGIQYLDNDLIDKDGDREYDVMSVSYEWVRQEAEEMTLSQVCEALGKDIKIIKEV